MVDNAIAIWWELYIFWFSGMMLMHVHILFHVCMYICINLYIFFCRTLISELVRTYSPLVKLGVLWPTTLSLEHSALQPCKHHLRISSFPVATGKTVSRSCPLMMEGWCRVSDIIKMLSAVLQVRYCVEIITISFSIGYIK